MITSPIDLLMTFQRMVYDDRSRFIAWIAGRQVGKSFTGAGRAVSLAMRQPKTDVLIASPSERQSYEAVLKCRDWSKAFDFAIADILEERDAPGALMSSATIRFPNESRIIAVPGKPDTVRGFSAHVWMDEFAFFEDPSSTWKAIFPSISNPLKGLKKVFLTSTPNGKSGRGKRFFDIVTDCGRIDPEHPSGIANSGTFEPTPWHYKSGSWSIHRTPVTYAAPQLGTDIEELRKAVDDEEAWQQEFLCSFIDTSSVLLPYDLIATCEDFGASVQAPAGFYDRESHAAIDLGIDFGRTNDPTVCWALERVGDVAWTREVLTLRATNTVDQYNILRSRVERARRVCLDYTGPGIGLGDMLIKNFGVYDPAKDLFGKIELCTFTANFKRDIFPKFKTAFDSRSIRVPVDVNTREDLHEMQQVISNGQYSYQARRTAEGHSDRCTAGALAWRAASSGGEYVAPFSVGKRRGYERRKAV